MCRNYYGKDMHIVWRHRVMWRWRKLVFRWRGCWVRHSKWANWKRISMCVCESLCVSLRSLLCAYLCMHVKCLFRVRVCWCAVRCVCRRDDLAECLKSGVAGTAVQLQRALAGRSSEPLMKVCRLSFVFNLHLFVRAIFVVSDLLCVCRCVCVLRTCCVCCGV